MLKIHCNNIARQMVSFFDLPVDKQSEFDYFNEDDKYDYRIVKYKGHYYDIYDTQRIEVTNVTANASPMGWSMVVYPDDPFAKFDSIISESYFSGVLFKFIDDSVICARYYS